MQKAVLAGVNTGDVNFERSMEELKRLVEACDAEPAGMVTQNLDAVNPALYVGPGKIQDVAVAVSAMGADTVVLNDELTPSQIRNLEKALECGVLDRTSLILEIFARRARTREAALQVETARLKYTLPRLIGLRLSYEQQTGGVGTTNRGAGEKELELNRRQIQSRIARLDCELAEIDRQRQTQRRQRKKSGLPVVSLVGYTNSGKSTIMNAMLEMSSQPEEKKVLEKDMLFATLDTSVRNITLSDNKAFLLTDTVGFIDRLPHHLVKAFRTTLEEACDADLIIHVVDASDPDYAHQMEVTGQTLSDIGASAVPVIYAFNKSDRLDIPPYCKRDDAVYISAKNKTGLDTLIGLIKGKLFADYVRCRMLIPYRNGDVLSYLSSNANIFSTEYVGEGTALDLELRTMDYERYREFVTEKTAD